MNVTLSGFLGALGLTKKSAADALLAMLTRRVAIVRYNEAEQFLPVSDEMSMFLAKSSYRKQMKSLGKHLRGTFMGREDLVKRLLGVFEEHSVTAETLLDKFEDDDSGLVVDDETVETAIGEVVGLLRNYAGPALGVELEGAFAPDAEARTAFEPGSSSKVLGEALKAILDGETDEVLYPDIHQGLSRK